MRVKHFINRTMWVVLIASIMFSIVGCNTGSSATAPTSASTSSTTNTYEELNIKFLSTSMGQAVVQL